MIGAALGYRYELEDRAELHATATAVELGALRAAEPKPFSNRNWFRAWNQGPIGSCSGHAMAGAQKSLNHEATGEIVDPSRMLAYLLGQKFSGTFGKDEGGTIYGVVKGATDYGNCLERFFPYPEQYTTSVPGEAIRQAAGHAMRSHVVVRGYSDAITLLATRQIKLLIGVGWTEDMARSRDGVISRQHVFGGSRMLGGHALLVDGISERRDDEGRYYPEGPNSHGEEYGNRGWIEWEPALFDEWGRGEGPFQAEMIAVSKFPPFELQQRINWLAGGVL